MFFSSWQQNENFFDLFRHYGDLLLLAANCCAGTEGAQSMETAEAQSIGQRSERLWVRMIFLLRRSFSAPFDREDILLVAQSAEHVLESMEVWASNHREGYSPHKSIAYAPSLLSMAQLLRSNLNLLEKLKSGSNDLLRNAQLFQQARRDFIAPNEFGHGDAIEMMLLLELRAALDELNYALMRIALKYV